MIVEDDNGNDIDLSDLDDDREPEPPEPEDESLTLEEIEATLITYSQGWGAARDQAIAFLLRVAVPQMLTELRHWRSLGKEPQHGVLLRNPDQWIVYDDVETATEAAELRGGTAGVRDVYVTPWRTFSNEPPF